MVHCHGSLSSLIILSLQTLTFSEGKSSRHRLGTWRCLGSAVLNEKQLVFTCNYINLKQCMQTTQKAALFLTGTQLLSQLSLPCVSYSSCCDQMSDKKQPGEEGFIWAQGSEEHSPSWWGRHGDGSQRWLVTLYSQSENRGK